MLLVRHRESPLQADEADLWIAGDSTQEKQYESVIWIEASSMKVVSVLELVKRLVAFLSLLAQVQCRYFPTCISDMSIIRETMHEY